MPSGRVNTFKRAFRLLIVLIFYNISGRMGLLRYISYFAFLVVVLSSCSGKVVCPAYSSYFMLDEEYRDKHFSYFGEDSLPSNALASVEKTWYGTIKEPKLLPFYRKNESLKTVPMELVFAKVPDSVALAGDELMYAEMDVVDSTRIANEQRRKDRNWNVEQEYYFRRIRDLIITEEDLAEGRTDAPAINATTGEPVQKKGFFGRLFGKKDKSEEESVGLNEDETGVDEAPPPKEKKKKEKKEKKGLFGKKNKDDQAADPGKKDDDEEEGEGF